MIVFASSALNVVFNLGLITASIILLWKGADFLVDSAGRVASRFGISDLVIGLTIVAIGTSAPEFAVTVTAAVKGQADISVGNIVGSNIFNIGIILGIVAIFSGVKTGRKIVYRDCIFMVSITLMLLFFFRDFYISRIESAILFSMLILYTGFLLIKKEPLMPGENASIEEKAGLKDALILPLSLVTIIAGGHLLVESSVFVARTAGISEWIIGVTIVAAGTSAPEMAAAVAALIKRKPGMSAGSLIGSDIFNILGVLGLAGLISPMTIGRDGFNSLIMLSGMAFLVLFFMRTGWRLSRTEGAVLVAIGILRWIFDIAG